MKFVSLALALVASNFIYQAVTSRNWKVAAERSWFQVVAIFLAFLACQWAA